MTRAFTPILLAFGILLGIHFSAGQSHAGNNTIFKTWRFMGDDTVETIEIGSKEVRRKISGRGLPGGGMEIKNQVVEVTPKATASQGKIILRSELGEERNYQVIYWFELKEKSVNLCISGKRFCDPKEAKVEEKEIKERGRLFRALPWGIE
jgi:hypothetical protein